MRGVGRSCAFGVVMGVGVGAGCWHTASGHCGNLDGDFTCAERGGGQYCDACQADGDGCADVMPAEGCHFAGMGGGGTSTSGVESTSSGEPSTTSPLTADSGDTSSSTSIDDSASSTGAAMCQGNEECLDTKAPFCDPRGECVSCNGLDDPDGACMTLDPELPYCMEGECVQCTAHGEQCAGAGCNLFTNACLPADAVVHVGGMTPDYASLSDAVMSFRGDDGTIIVHGGSYEEPITLASGNVLAILADPRAGRPVWRPKDTDDVPLSVQNGSFVLLDGLRLWNSNDDKLVNLHPPLTVAGGHAWIDRSVIVDNQSTSIVVETGGELVLRNSLVGGNDPDGSAGLQIDGSSARILYSSLLGGPDDEDVSLACTDPISIEIRNSLIVARSDGPEVSCEGVSATYTASENVLDALGEGNVVLGPTPQDVLEDWFCSYGEGNFGLSGSHPPAINTVARWTTSDPSTDFDYTLRPSSDGSPDYAGGDVPRGCPPL
jgi:hypothetical protein